ncbi:hypothetical protein BKI52_06270 [marine bacterium AO1-C]|nr:hypothetical protein BKI52_06270 [marine bacterium AO1-C]
MRISKILILLAMVCIMACGGNNNNTESKGHTHGTGTKAHTHGEGEKAHTHDKNDEHKQEEFTVGTDSVKTKIDSAKAANNNKKTPKKHTHEDGTTHHNH